MVLDAILRIFHPAPHIAAIADTEKVDKTYKYWRHRIFYSMLIGYAFYYFSRRSFTFAMPGLIADLGFEKSELGILGSVLSISYGMSKFISGVLADKSNPRYFMALGLFLTGLCNIFFGLSSSLGLFILFWGANGLFQGFGWPACARTLTNWYSHSERGSWWSATSVAHNLGAFVTPWIVGFALQYYGWRAGMFIPGVMCFVGALFLINRLRDTPQSMGLPTIETYRNDIAPKSSVSQEATTKELLWNVLSNPIIWLLGVAYFFVYVLRMGIGDWTALFLYEVKGYGALGSSGTSSLFEAGGFFGCLSAGYISDKFFSARRTPVCVLYAAGIFASVVFFWLVPHGYLVLDWIAIFLMGFMVFGPQMLIGIAASELCDKKAAATANGFVGWVAYIGAAVSGYPIGLIIDRTGWSRAFVFLMISAFILLLVLLPLWGRAKEPIKAAPTEG